MKSSFNSSENVSRKEKGQKEALNCGALSSLLLFE